MKYMLLIYGEEDILNDEQRQDCYAESKKLAWDLAAEGKFLAAAPLHPISTATSVRIRDGRSLITDGPFAEAREQLGGYFLIDANNLDEALAVAHRIPGAKWGTIEVRPVIEVSGLPSPASADVELAAAGVTSSKKN